MHREREQCLHRLGAVDQRQSLFGLQNERLQPMLAQHFGRRTALNGVTGCPQPPLTDQWLRQMGELGQVPGGADGSLAGHNREQVLV